MLEHGPLLTELLAGKSICKITDEENYRRLQNETRREDINKYLRPLNRRIATTKNESVYFLAYQELNAEARNHLAKEFDQTIKFLLPLLEWMQLTQEALGNDSVFSIGDIIDLYKYARSIESNQALQKRFSKLASNRFFNSSSSDLQNQLKQVFKKLEDNNYLHKLHKDQQYYIITGKIEYLIEIIEFIKEEELLQIEETSQQEPMF
jgi:hypothetical protein